MTAQERKPDAWDYTRAMLLRSAAMLIFLCAAAYSYAKGFVEGVLESRETYLLQKETAAAGETPFPDRPRPAARPKPSRPAKNYEVLCDQDSEVTLNGLPIGHIDSAPWQFCSYDIEYGNGPARPSKARAWDDACDYAESVARSV